MNVCYKLNYIYHYLCRTPKSGSKKSVVFSDTIFYENILNIEPVLLKLIMILTNIPSILRHPRISGSETPVRILDTPSAPQYFAFRSKIY